jgi:branched-chain amino acid aminotransferase
MHLNLADLEARDVDDRAWPILLDAEGDVAEGSGANLFVVCGGILRTPGEASILQGVTRKVVLELAEDLGIPVQVEAIQPYDIYTADEVFFTSTPFCVLPVTQVDRRQIGGGQPGPVATRLLAAFSEVVGIDVVDQALRFRDSRSNI